MRHALVALAFWTLLATPTWAQQLDLIGKYNWELPVLNGLSAIEMEPDGLGFTSVSDLGWVLRADIERDGDIITNVTLISLDPILSEDNLPVAARRINDWSDAEGLAISPDGRKAISFERWAHVWDYADFATPPKWVRDHPEFYDYGDNRQLEALAIDPEGRLVTIGELPHPDYGGFPVYRENGGPDGWEIAGLIQSSDRFAVVGADYGPDGMLYILERKLILGLWWQSRIRRFSVPDGSGDILWTSARGEYLNLEGISVWEDDTSLRLTLISDNNRSRREITQIIEFRLTQ